MLTIISDVHGKISDYLSIIEKEKYTLQLGDLGFNYDFLTNIDSNKHKFIAGNHDNYDLLELNNYPHNLGDFGLTKHGGVEFFFIRGAYSIDKQYRIPGLSWWPQEQLNYQQTLECLDQYLLVRPKIVITHDCPDSILHEIFGYEFIINNSTGHFFSTLFHEHQPDLWIFGHHHKSVCKIINGTRFLCLDELEIFMLAK